MMEMLAEAGRNIINLWFADVQDVQADLEQELGSIAESLDKTSTRYKMEDQTDHKQRQGHPETNEHKSRSRIV